ncbi:substrate-binding domain-containing protein [Gordoniibacillus kamchatkensis]|uniref:substrate-binding domain-containing protein n=1 Tax=Gordoniibacillus kamchatkensis TaxID=1590651 RepID=UPI0026A416B6
MTGKSTYTVGLLVPDLANLFFAEIARSVEDRGHELGFNLVICSTANNPVKESQYISLLKQKRADGIIIATGLSNDSLLAELVKQKVPVALIARDMPSLTVNCVLVDDFNGGYQAASHLIKRGHKRIAAIAEELRIASSRERIRGYRHALEEAGIPCDDELVLVSDYTVDGGKRCMAKLLEQPAPPSAVFACNDLLAIGAVQAVREAGSRVPDDVSIVGFDNTLLATIIDPALTTIAQPIQEMGRIVMDLLVGQISGEDHYKQRVILLPKLIVRGSSR